MRKGTPCILDQTNTSRKTLDLIADKWVILILFALRNGTRRFAQMHRDIGGITQKMLIQVHAARAAYEKKHKEKDALV
jgi:DNA-binding HxlR family transcriptional regulator